MHLFGLFKGLVIGGSLMLLAAGCASVSLQEDPEDYREEAAALLAHLEANPDDAEALRDLGIIYLRTARYTAAQERLEAAYVQRPDEAETLFHYALALELNNQPDEALALYARYTDVARVSPYRARMAGRYRWLNRELIRQDIQARLADETAFSNAPPGTIGVFPFAYQGTDDRFAPLGRGLAEMMTNDLAQVQALTVVERLRVQVLLDEIDLARQTDGAIDPATAPRAGRLLGAQQLVSGTFDVPDGERLRLNAAVFSVEAKPVGLDTRDDVLDNLFILQKDLVFGIIDELGITLTREEREAIDEVPTRNLQAFLAYSRGLEAEDNGQFEQAASFFQQAQTLDPSFSQAGQQAEATATGPGGQPEQQLGPRRPGARGPGAGGPPDLVHARNQNLNNTVGRTYVPGEDHRRPAAEAADAGAADPDALPTPLPPPSREGN